MSLSILPTVIRSLILEYGIHHRDRFKASLELIRMRCCTCFECLIDICVIYNCVNCNNSLCEECDYDCHVCF